MEINMEMPFSSGSEAADWYSRNCDNCVKAYFPKKEGEWPSHNTMKQYCSIGKECKLKFAIDIGFITSEVPKTVVDQIGRNEKGFIAETCMLFSDNSDDGYKPKPRPNPDNTPDNQMVMPFIIESVLNRKQLV